MLGKAEASWRHVPLNVASRNVASKEANVHSVPRGMAHRSRAVLLLSCWEVEAKRQQHSKPGSGNSQNAVLAGPG